MPARLDSQRGFDHGTFTPLVVMYPEANVPVLELSLKSGMTRPSIFPSDKPLRHCATKVFSSSAAA